MNVEEIMRHYGVTRAEAESMAPRATPTIDPRSLRRPRGARTEYGYQLYCRFRYADGSWATIALRSSEYGRWARDAVRFTAYWAVCQDDVENYLGSRHSRVESQVYDALDGLPCIGWGWVKYRLAGQ